jgi:hypothetical protein
MGPGAQAGTTRKLFEIPEFTSFDALWNEVRRMT